MLKIPNPLSRLNRVGLPRAIAPLSLGVALLTTAVPPAKALPVVQGGVNVQVGDPHPVYPSTIIYGSPPSTIIYSSPNTSSIIYGSPIPNPVPQTQWTQQYVYPSNGYYYNVNPVVPLPGQVVTPGIYDPFGSKTVIVNPPGYSTNLNYPRQVFYGYPGNSYGYPAYGYPRNTRIFIRN